MKLKSWAERTVGSMKLGTKLLAAFLVLSLAPVSIVGVYAYRYIYNSLTTRVEEGLEASILQQQVAADGELARYEQVLYFLMYDQQTVNMFNGQGLSYYDIYYNLELVYEPLLLTIRELNKDIARIGVYTDHPQFRPRGTEIMDLDVIRDELFTQEVMRKRSVCWKAENGMLTAMGLLMRTRRSSPNSIVYMDVPADVLMKYETGEVSAWAMAITDGNDVLAVKKEGGFEADISGLTAAETGIACINGEKYMVVRQPMNRSKWSLMFVCEYDQLNIDLSSLVWMCLLALIGSGGTVVIISVLVSRSITGRVSKLNASMGMVEKGELTNKPVVNEWEKDEIADITKHFGNMMDSLNDYIRINYENQIEVRDAEMKMLQAQINPHFLYNTLSMINWMAVEHNEAEISEALMQLSRFYRMVLVFSEGHVKVKDEIENVTCYTDLQLRLHEHSFDVMLDIDKKIMDYGIIGMILQPIVENAVEHGIDMIRNGRGCLKVKGYLQGDDIIFDISDNGPGMTREQFDRSITENSKGYGLKNVNDRLRISCGQNYGLEMPETGSGTLIRVKHPARKPDTESEGEN